MANPTNARVAATGVSRTFALHPLLSANGVIASSTSGPVFGFGDPGAHVAVTLTNAAGSIIARASALVDSNGKWVASLGSIKTSTGYTLTARSGSDTLKSKNIAVGQLWLVSGQSNVFVSLGDIEGDGAPWEGLAASALATASKDKDLRLFKVRCFMVCGVCNLQSAVGGFTSAGSDPTVCVKEYLQGESNQRDQTIVILLPLLQVPTLQSATPKVTVGAEWMLPSKDVVDSFSAVAYLTGSQLRAKLKVPVGIVQASYGETFLWGLSSRRLSGYGTGPLVLQGNALPSSSGSCVRAAVNARVIGVRCMYCGMKGMCDVGCALVQTCASEHDKWMLHDR